MKMLILLWALFVRAVSWHLYIGTDPSSVRGPAVILFPYRPATLCCGLAGIIAIKHEASIPDGTSYAAEIISRLEEMERCDLSSILAGAIPVDSYLGGEAPFTAITEALLRIKERPTFRAIFTSPENTQMVGEFSGRLNGLLAQEEAILQEKASAFVTSELELINGRLITLKDIAWEVERDLLGNLERIMALAGGRALADLGEWSLENYRTLNLLLNAIDRLEVRGRDSAGMQMSFVIPTPTLWEDINRELVRQNLVEEFNERCKIGELYNRSISISSNRDHVTFTFKTFSVIGELGRNVGLLRREIAGDGIFHTFCERNIPSTTALVHTRWASVGAITEENCHPVNNYSLKDESGIKDFPRYGRGQWAINAVLNGDIDNYRELRARLEQGGELISPDVTTDTKIIPLLIEHYLKEGHDFTEAFRRATADFDGSHAIAVTSNCEPEKVFLALKGSGQSLYVGLAPDAYVFSSEVYGLIERTPYFVKMQGEATCADTPSAREGQIFVLDGHEGGISGITAMDYDGAPVRITHKDVARAEITTRDIDRGPYPHFFLKEISEAPTSVAKTLRGKYRFDGGDGVTFNFGPDIVPTALIASITEERIKQIVIIGHGTAAVAGMAIADGWQRYLAGGNIRIEGTVASEMSGFYLKDDLSDTLVIPITQSGTTTDTNRAVAMARERGAWVIAIVNRRQSDITTKAHGVFYTSDGRDIEMAVASTKAFYSQLIAGHLLGLYFAQLLGTMSGRAIAQEIRNMERVVPAMHELMANQDQIRQAAFDLAPTRRYWAVVGSGPNKAASDEIRIKLSELCYKTISSDIVENKKHIDLSAEPLIIVCAAGYPDHVVGDIVKDVAIFRAHRAAIVVFADREEERFYGIADYVIPIPEASPPIPVILNTMAGHLWGYFAALSLDEGARFFREFRERLNLRIIESRERPLSFYDIIADRRFRHTIQEFAAKLNARRQRHLLALIDGNTLSDLILLLKYAAGKIPLEEFWQDFPDEDDNGFTPLDRLDMTLGRIIDEFTRPIDAIRHQAKTVTVGTSRKELSIQGPIHALIVSLGFSPRHLTSKSIVTLNRIQGAVTDIAGYTLYEVTPLDEDGHPTEETLIRIVDRGGVTLQMTSRAEQPVPLMGTKRTVASMGHVYIGQGKLDQASIIIVPLATAGQKDMHLLLIHVRFNEALPLRTKIDLLGYKYQDIKNIIMEYNLPWHDTYLDSIPIIRLLGEPAEVIAGEIKAGCINGREST